MSQEQKFFICKHCGNLVGMIHNAGVKIICCGEPMTELVPNTTDAAGEKHLPVVEVSGKQVTVSIGSVPHPMAEEHHIAWVYLQTAKGGQRKSLPVGGEPKVTFLLEDDEPVAALASPPSQHLATNPTIAKSPGCHTPDFSCAGRAAEGPPFLHRKNLACDNRMIVLSLDWKPYDETGGNPDEIQS